MGVVEGGLEVVIDVYVNVNYSWGIVSRTSRQCLSPVCKQERKPKLYLARNLKRNEHGISIFNQ